MTIAIVGSRSLDVDIPDNLIPEGVTRIYSGAAAGIDSSARRYAQKHGILLTDIIPEYDLYGRTAPLKRNDIIIEKADRVYIFWDGKSRGSKYVINRCRKLNKPYKVFQWISGEFKEISWQE